MSTEEGLTKDYLKNLIGDMGKKLLIIKFSASWCAPCKKIKPLCEKNITKLREVGGENIIILNINIDNDLELYGWLKRQRVVAGIPCILAYYGGEGNELWYSPNDSVCGGDSKKVQLFFNRCQSKVQSL